MGIIHNPHPVLLFVAALFNPRYSEDDIVKLIEREFGSIALRTEVFPFDFSDYYRREMGDGLQKFFTFIDRLIMPEELLEWKLRAHNVEQRHANSGHRVINCDPGYLEVPKLVLASTKNFSHRIYLGKGIYGDVQLFYRDEAFRPNSWTYPDYQLPQHLQFFQQARSFYRDKLSTHTQ